MIGAADHRQDRRGEGDRLGGAMAAVAHARPAHLDRADAGLDPPLGRVAVADHPTSAMLIHEPGMGGQKRLDLGLDRVGQHPPGALAQHRQQRVVRDGTAWAGQRNDKILLHGVSSRVT
jgi:hypothetical protein